MFSCSPARALQLAAAAAAAIAASTGSAQTAPSRPDPALAGAPVPPIKYVSPLAGYRAFAEARPTPWRQASDAPEAPQPAPAASAAGAAHGHHHHRSAP